MGVGLAFLRKREDGTWEGDYTLRGRGEFSEFQDLVFSLEKPFVIFPSFRDDEYDFQSMQGPPPYPAQVGESLAEDLEHWSRRTGPELLQALRQIPADQVEPAIFCLKSLVENYLAEGYAIVVSY